MAVRARVPPPAARQYASNVAPFIPNAAAVQRHGNVCSAALSHVILPCSVDAAVDIQRKRRRREAIAQGRGRHARAYGNARTAPQRDAARPEEIMKDEISIGV